MPRLSGFTLLLVPLLLVLVLFPTILPVRAATYLPGVTTGQWASYKVAYDRCVSTDPTICTAFQDSITQLNNTEYAIQRIVNVSGTSITVDLGIAYNNSTSQRRTGVVDVATGSSNLTGVVLGPPGTGNFIVLAGNLQAHDKMWNSPTAPALNLTRTETVLGTTRVVNFLNTSSSTSYGTSGDFAQSTGLAYDQKSGMMIQTSFSIVLHSQGGTSGVVTTVEFSLRMVDNNIWLSGHLPDFTIAADPNTINTIPGRPEATTITIARDTDFHLSVTLHAVSPSTTLTCDVSPGILSTPSQTTTTLSCSGLPGTYLVSVKADGGIVFHDTTVTVNVVQAPADFAISSSGNVNFQSGSSGTTTITVTGSNGFSSNVNLEITSSSSSLSCAIDKTSVPVNGQATVRCTGQPGSYTITIKATSGSSSHSTQVPVEVKTLSAANQPGNILSSYYLYAGIGAVIAAAVAAVLLFLRKKPETVTPSVVGETSPAPPPPVAQP